MNYQVSDEPPRQKNRTDGTASEEEELLQSLHCSWPEAILHLRDSESIPSNVLEILYREHTLPHENCGRECWHISGRFGKNRQYGVFALFTRFAIVDDDNPSDVQTPLTFGSSVQWAVIDHKKKKYYRFSEVDHRSPVLVSSLLAKDAYECDESHLIQAMAEQLQKEVLILPDRVMPGPTSVRLNDLQYEYNKNIFELVQLTAGKTPGTHPNYHLHLEGQTFETGDTALENEATVVLDLVLQQDGTVVLQGDHGILPGEYPVEDMFAHFNPHLRVIDGSLRISRASDALELGRDLDIHTGNMWIEHQFGVAVPRTLTDARTLAKRREKGSGRGRTKRRRDWCELRIFNEAQDCVSISSWSGGSQSRSADVWSVAHRGATGQGHMFDDGVQFSPVPDKQYRSVETGILYATEWEVKTPLGDGSRLEVLLKSAFLEQEFITSTSRPGYWKGSVTVEGFIISQDESTKQPVLGEGLLKCHGHQTPIQQLYETLHLVAEKELEIPMVAALPSWEAIAEGPALSAVTTFSVMLSLQDHPLCMSHKVILATLLGTCGYILHHTEDQEKVWAAIEWCNSRWSSHYAHKPIDYRTLQLRGLMLHELSVVLQRTCFSWVPKWMTPLDLMCNLPRCMMDGNNCTDETILELIIPSEEELMATAVPLEVAQLKGLLDGTWIMKDGVSKGSPNTYLACQGVSVAWRTFLGKLCNAIRVLVDPESLRIDVQLSNCLKHWHVPVYVNSEPWEWEDLGRGKAISRACVRESGHELYMETELLNGVERIWVRFEDGGRTLIVVFRFYNTMASKQSIISYEQSFTYEMPENDV